jgi:prolipoprotein diacylglyceryltransferase
MVENRRRVCAGNRDRQFLRTPGMLCGRLLLGQADDAAVGREVYELGHEITGVPTDTYLHPTQLYESFAMLLVFLFLLWLHKRKRFSGQVILAYALLYSAIRFAIEFVRDDPRGDVFGLTTLTGLSTSQLISLVIGIARFDSIDRASPALNQVNLKIPVILSPKTAV